MRTVLSHGPVGIRPDDLCTAHDSDEGLAGPSCRDTQYGPDEVATSRPVDLATDIPVDSNDQGVTAGP